ncbi:DUF4381 domain-containing protein [Sneathiella marina]|uniref:DUF4381 domain-containing protein n=1 Tax=Sneathiella marina TaxID=2950108 RepID=A0ABY4VXZ5_9PROT|nr:DUF4381 domain-containing protein [Sneathiella marina]USG59802.1 DUF4381 domain-containing protein [Sneathiella marina]
MADNSMTASELFGSNRMWGLKEIPLPEPVSFFPDTVGWLTLAALFGLFLCFLFTLFLRRWRKKAPLRQAIRDLRDISDQQHNYSQIPLILRQTALQQYDRDEVASLRGRSYTDWLNTKLKNPVFDPRDSELLATLPYTPSEKSLTDIATLNGLVQKSIVWLKNHHV